MSKHVEPAMTARMWADVEKYGVDLTEARVGPLGHFDPHEVAALCLHGQPYGFTREDVNLLVDFERDLRRSAYVNDRPEGLSARYADQAESLANRIGALLPPEEET